MPIYEVTIHPRRFSMKVEAYDYMQAIDKALIEVPEDIEVDEVEWDRID